VDDSFVAWSHENVGEITFKWYYNMGFNHSRVSFAVSAIQLTRVLASLSTRLEDLS